MNLTLSLLSLLLQPVQPQPLQPKKEADAPSNVSASITLRDVDLAELIDKLKLDLSYKVAGKLTVKATLSAPLSDAISSSAYTIRGTFTSSELSIEGMRFQKLNADVVYANGKLTLSKLNGTLPAATATGTSGTFSGSASAAIEPRGDMKADLALTSIPLGEVLRLIPDGVAVTGNVDGKAEFRAPVDKLSDPASWNATSELTASTLNVFDRTITNAKLALSIADGKATLRNAAATVEGIPLAGDATITLSGKYPFTAVVKSQPQSVSELRKLVPEAEIPVPITGKLATTSTATGTISPFTISAEGAIDATDLTIAKAPAEKVSAKWKVTDERVTLSDLNASIFSGSITGFADYPLKADKTGKFQLNFKDVDSGSIVAAFPKVPVKIAGSVSGNLNGSIPVSVGNANRAITSKLELKADKLTVQNIPAEELNGSLSLHGTAVRYELEGKTLGGSFEVKGQYPEAIAPKELPVDPDGEGLIRIRNIDLSRIARVLRLTTPLQGLVDFNFRYTADLSQGSGSYSLRGFRYGTGQQLTLPQISGRLRLRNGTFEAFDLVGPVSVGSLRANVRGSLADPSRNFYRLSLDRADASKLISTFTGISSNVIDGGISLTVRGKFWPEFRAVGTLGLSRGSIGGITVSDVRLPFDLFVRSSSGQLNIRDAVGTFGNGRANGQLEYGWGASGRMNGQLRFTNVGIGKLFSDLKQSNYFGSARATGRIDISGENVLSAEDLKGTIVASISQAAVRDLPALSSITPFISPTALVKPFDTGELRANLSRGVLRIQELTLASPSADLYADGNITTSGRVDLGVIVRTGTIGLNDTAIRRIGVSLPLYIGPIPVQVVRDISAFLSNRTVRLTITGTLASPQPQVNTAHIFTDEAIRFLLRRYLPGTADILPEISPRLRR